MDDELFQQYKWQQLGRIYMTYIVIFIFVFFTFWLLFCPKVFFFRSLPKLRCIGTFARAMMPHDTKRLHMAVWLVPYGIWLPFFFVKLGSLLRFSCLFLLEVTWLLACLMWHIKNKFIQAVYVRYSEQNFNLKKFYNCQLLTVCWLSSLHEIWLNQCYYNLHCLARLSFRPWSSLNYFSGGKIIINIKIIVWHLKPTPSFSLSRSTIPRLLPVGTAESSPNQPPRLDWRHIGHISTSSGPLTSAGRRQLFLTRSEAAVVV